MYRKKSFFFTFEGIEGSGKSYLSKLIYKELKKKNIPSIITREPGGTLLAEKIRKIILDDYFEKNSKQKFDIYTDTLLYLAARNEHVKNIIKPSILKKKVIICDRFTDSTLAYQVFGKKVNINFVNSIHKYILQDIKPDLTFVLKVSINKAFKRINKRKKKNRYDKFPKKFYISAQNSFLKIAKKNKKRYLVLDNSNDSSNIKDVILNKIMDLIKK